VGNPSVSCFERGRGWWWQRLPSVTRNGGGRGGEGLWWGSGRGWWWQSFPSITQNGSGRGGQTWLAAAIVIVIVGMSNISSKYTHERKRHTESPLCHSKPEWEGLFVCWHLQLLSSLSSLWALAAAVVTTALFVGIGGCSRCRHVLIGVSKREWE